MFVLWGDLAWSTAHIFPAEGNYFFTDVNNRRDNSIMKLGPDSLGLSGPVAEVMQTYQGRSQLRILVRNFAFSPQPFPFRSTRKGLVRIQADDLTLTRVSLLLQDLCTGSGVQGISAAIHAGARGATVDLTLVDVNPRSRRFVTANMLMNGVKGVWREGDILKGLPAALPGESPFDGAPELWSHSNELRLV